MKTKPVILIFNARDERGDIANLIRDAVNKIGSYNAVTINETMYINPNDNKFLEYLDTSFLGEKLRIKAHVDAINKKNKRIGKRDKRIINAIERFKPVYVIAVSPLSHQYLVEAKIKGNLSVPIIYYCPQFTADNGIINAETNLYLLENQDIKNSLVLGGLDKSRARVLGFPYSLDKLDHEKTLLVKQELGLPKGKVVLINISDFDMCKKVLEVLVDQGDIFSIAVNCESGNVKGFAETIDRVKGVNVKFVEKNLDEYLSVSDVLITEGDVSVLYKAFSIEVPVIGVSNDALEERDLKYLDQKNAIMYAENEYDVLRQTYEIIQTDRKIELKDNAKFLISISSIENIAEFLTNFLDFEVDKTNGKD